MLTLATGFIRGDNFLCDFRREPVMDKMYERVDILDREATHTLLPLGDHVGDIRKFFIGESANPLDKIVTVLCKMVGNRWKDGMEHMPGSRTGKIPAFRCEFFQNRNVLLGKFTWHYSILLYYFTGFGINVREGHRSLSRSGVVSPLMRQSPRSLVFGA